MYFRYEKLDITEAREVGVIRYRKNTISFITIFKVGIILVVVIVLKKLGVSLCTRFCIEFTKE
jgi:hypothetical protein